MKNQILTALAGLGLLVGCQVTPGKEVFSSGLEAQVGKYCWVDLTDSVKSGVDGTLVKATDTWIVLRRPRTEKRRPGGPLSTEWIPRDSIVSIEFREGSYDKVAKDSVLPERASGR